MVVKLFGAFLKLFQCLRDTPESQSVADFVKTQLPVCHFGHVHCEHYRFTSLCAGDQACMQNVNADKSFMNSAKRNLGKTPKGAQHD